MLLNCVADTPFRQRVIASIFASVVRDHLEIGNLDSDVLKDTRFIPLAVARAINVPAGQAFIEAYKALKTNGEHRKSARNQGIALISLRSRQESNLRPAV